MGVLSVSVPDDLRFKINKLDEVNWSAVARKAFEEKIKEIEIFKKIVSKSMLLKDDSDEISIKINKNMAKKYKDM